MPQVASTRWCPTPEQLMILEEMYRSGVRTPNASQIQQITAHLSRYGRIEGKNVFYWFQNHKARERQKLRRRLSRYHQLLYSGVHSSFPPVQLPQYHQLQCLQETPLSPLPVHNGIPSHFLHQDSNQGLNLLCKLDAGGCEELCTVKNSGYGYEHMVMMDVGSSIPPCCRPLKTLDLFPTSSTSLKDECTTSKSSSSTSTN